MDVVVEVAGRDLTFREVGGRHYLQLEFAYRTIDELARSDNNRTTTLTFNLTSDELHRVRQTGLRWIFPVEVSPGRHALRLAGQVVGGARAGVVFTDIDVPRLGQSSLWIGGLALTSASAALAVTAGRPSAALELPSPATTARTFTRGDVITVSSGVIVPPTFSQGLIRLAVHAPGDAAGAVRLERTTRLPNRATAGQPRAWTLDTQGLGTGQFVLRLTLQDDRGSEAESALLFEVVER